MKSTWTTEDHTTWNLSHPKKGTLHQIDFYLILTLGPRNRLGYCVKLWHYIKEDNDDDDDDDDDDNSNNNK